MAFTLDTLRASLPGAGPVAKAVRFDAIDHAYLRLLSQFCVMAQLPFPEAALDGDEFAIDGIDFRFRVDGKRAPGMLNVWCDVGPVPPNGEQSCYRLLLESDLYYQGRFSATMALCPETGWVVNCARAPIDGLTATELYRFVKQLAAHALAWQRRAPDAVNAAPALAPRAERGADMPAKPWQDDAIVLLLNYCHGEGLGMHAVEAVLAGAPLLIDGASFIIDHSATTPDNVCSVYCDYGRLAAPADGVDLYRTMLMVNMLMFPALGHSMMISAHSNHLLLRHDFLIKHMKQPRLKQLIDSLARNFSEWKKKNPH
ncbi:MAG: CesT family type III secretion system chaperone [Pseudomonadota bacterium]